MMVLATLVVFYLLTFIEDEELEVLNTGEVTHFHSQTGIFTYRFVSLYF